MDDGFDPCEFIKECCEKPFELTERLTVRQFILLKEHVAGCKTCDDLITDVTNRYVPFQGGGILPSTN